MTDEPTELNGEWAWTQIESMADGSLEGIALERMQRALENDPRLRRAVARARSVHREASAACGNAALPTGSCCSCCGFRSHPFTAPIGACALRRR